MTRAALPTHPQLAARFQDAGPDRIYWRGRGVEAVIAGGKILAARGRGKPREAPAAVLAEGDLDFRTVVERVLGQKAPPGDPPTRRQARATPAKHPRGGSTTVVDILLPKDRFPTPADAAAWLIERPRPYRADQIEDTGTTHAGNFWRAHQVDAPKGKPLRTITFPPAKSQEGQSRIKALVVVDAPGRKGTPAKNAKPAKKKGDGAAMRANKRASAGTSAPIVLLSCSKTQAKGRTPVRAKDLYTSGLFKDSFALAQKLTSRGGTIRILSGKHGLLKPSQKVAPGDITLDGMSASAQRAWGARVLAQLVKAFGKGKRHFVCLAGEKYADAIKSAGPPEAWHCEEPLKGKGIGVRWKHVRKLLAETR